MPCRQPESKKERGDRQRARERESARKREKSYIRRFVDGQIDREGGGERERVGE